jgi:hypothetical protein
MPDQPLHSERYTIALMRKIDHMLQEPLTPQQRKEIEEAVAVFQTRKHPIDLRGVLPLHFARLYFVLLMGKDRRTEEAGKEHDLRQRPKFAARAVSTVFMLWPVYLMVGLGYYILTALPH